MSDLLEFLGISSKEAWTAWIRTNHPDRGGDTKRFQLVKEAYEAKFGLGGSTASEVPRASTRPSAASAATYSGLAEKLRKMHEDFTNPPHTSRQCEADTTSGKLCKCVKVRGTKYCFAHLAKFDPVAHAEVDKARMADAARRVVERDTRKEEREAQRAKRQRDVDALVADLRAKKAAASSVV